MTIYDKYGRIYEDDKERQVSAPGLILAAGEISEDYDKVPWNELIQDYTAIRNGGALESTSINILKYPILQAGFQVETENNELKEYINWYFDTLKDSFGGTNGKYELIQHILMALDFGCSFFEKIYEFGIKTDKGKTTNRISRLAPFKLETVLEFHYSDDMMLCGIRHDRRDNFGMSKFIDIPIEKLFFYSHNAEFGDPKGRSELRPIRHLYKFKKEIITATARSQQRGAGIPEIKCTTGKADADTEAKMHAIGKTVGNMKNGYIITDANIEFTLHALQFQGSPEKTLDFINREIFFNTLTEFMTSGIGQSGSRSATEEHKSSYELKAAVITMGIENCLNQHIKEVCDLSYFGPQKKYPEIRFNALSKIDIVKAATSLISLYEKAIINKQEGDEQFLRDLFHMPKQDDKKIIKDAIKPQETVPPELSPVSKKDTTPSVVDKKKTEKKELSFTKVLSIDEQADFLKNTFDIEGASNLYLEFQKMSEAILYEVCEKAIKLHCRNYKIKEVSATKYSVEMNNRLQKLYRKSYTRGYKAVENEIKILKGTMTTLSGSNVDEDEMQAVSTAIKRYSDRLLFNIDTVIPDVLDSSWDPTKESAEEFIQRQGFLDGFKTDKRTLIEKTTDGYLDGRSASLTANQKDIELYYYNSILDIRLCDFCAKLTGSIFTEEELSAMDLYIGRGRVNPDCAGGLSRCRCNLVPYKLRGN